MSSTTALEEKEAAEALFGETARELLELFYGEPEREGLRPFDAIDPEQLTAVLGRHRMAFLHRESARERARQTVLATAGLGRG
jgi:hypothetical protein